MAAKNGKAYLLRIPIQTEEEIILVNLVEDISYIDAFFTLNYSKKEALETLKKYNPTFFKEDINID